MKLDSATSTSRGFDYFTTQEELAGSKKRDREKVNGGLHDTTASIHV